MIDLKKIYDSILSEDAVMAAGTGAVGGGEIAAPSGVSDADIVKSGMTTDDVIGKDCDHHKHGYLGPGCFHVPSRVCKMKREIPSGKKKKGLKNEYAKGMSIIEEAELDRKTILAIHSTPEEDIVDFVKQYDSKVLYIDAIVYYPIEKKYFIKYNIGGASRFVIADFDGKSFISDPNSNDMKTYSGKEVKNMYKDVNTKMKLWVVYGYEE